MAESATTQTFEIEAQYRLVDDIPGVAAVRAEVRQEAVALLEQRRQAYEQHQAVEYVKVDALSTAREVHDAIQQFGEGSEQHLEKAKGLVLDCQRLVGEWYRKKRPEYFPPLRHVFDQDKEEFFSHGLSIRQMTENALVPIKNNAEEEARRVNERVEDATPYVLRKLGGIALGVESILTVSECTDKAIADYQHDMATQAPHRGYDGYVPEIKKTMIRMIRPDHESDDRFEEQIGLPGDYITHEIFQIALARRGVNIAHMNKTELHGSQIVTEDDLMGFAKLLDEVASEQWCVNIFMGELVADDFVKDYDGFRDEALARQEKLKDEALTVANFVMDLAETNVDRRKAPQMVEDFVKKLLIEVAKNEIRTSDDTSVAESMFDNKTAAGLVKVVADERAGNFDRAYERQREVEQAAPGGGFCGAGACGLESVNIRSEEGKQLLEKLQAKPGDIIVRDTERPCKCGSKSVVYAYNKKQVNKLCEDCGAFESKQSKVA